ncbi:MAG: uncharacterized protein QG597_3122 [Actinomycetota bacterium]|nr:uncharacterized protein [Actinomycetota bacterium]
MQVRRLSDADQPAVAGLLGSDHVAHAMVWSRLVNHGINRSGGDLWGAWRRGRLRAVTHVSGNLIPAGGDAEAVDSIGEFLARMPRRSASIVGLARDVVPMWSALAPAWGPARDERLSQPLMVALAAPQVEPDSGLRRAEITDAGALYPATVAMFTEEVGVSPLEASSEAAYRARLMWLIRQGRVFCRTDERGVVFKAEIAVATDRVCQVQGVWVRPDQRGRGVGSAAMAAVAHSARAVAPQVSLYVNDYNTAAVAAYRRAGFRQVGTMASVHF